MMVIVVLGTGAGLPIGATRVEGPTPILVAPKLEKTKERTGLEPPRE